MITINTTKILLFNDLHRDQFSRGAFETGRYLQLEEALMSNLFLTMLNQYGVPTDTFGDSTGNIDNELRNDA